jgi:uncharacterized protein YjbJ (UPF0337 family)
MNWDRIAGNWKQMKGALKERWGKLTDDELDQLYGCARDDADKQLREWENRQT